LKTDAFDAVLLVRAAENSRYYIALVLIASTGLRKGGRWAWLRPCRLDGGTLKVTAKCGRIVAGW
jgi:hypothetical protein